ncbi:MAG: NrfD/PsrC family molybdoenzyme membrane anchor subunit [Candidatus Electryonea clarkiae]|nr:NrfD/PsrC family molybdoenzyme membrane anchor subunit [Candidatus Electryonea clarkiae]MDP8287562.1 NrfD/PsrC family molybdoenzyme membrane anchor subunit [Candidatus Electryonea clarkiae]
MDPKVNGQLQKDWGLLLAIYLFLGGVGGGAYTIAAINSFLGKSMELSTTIGLWIGFPALLIGSVILIADLGNPGKFILAGLKPGTSWIARGVWIISLFMVFSFLHLVLHQFTEISKTATGMNVIAILGIIFAILTMAYTGILLGTSKGIPFWRSGMVPVLFVVSALVTGHFSIMLGMVIFNEGAATVSQLSFMAVEAVVVVVVEVLAILFFLQAAYRQPDARESVERIMRKTIFIVGYFIMGLGVPLVLMLILRYAMTESGLSAVLGVAFIGALLGLIGGLLLRLAILITGALPTLNMAGFQFRRIARPKDLKPGIGLTPPQ